MENALIIFLGAIAGGSAVAAILNFGWVHGFLIILLGGFCGPLFVWLTKY
jgi:hypothetical protein